MASPDAILTALSQLEARIVERIGSRMTEELNAFRLQINGGFDGIHHRIDRLEIEYEMIKVGLARLEADVATLKADVATLKAEMTQVKGLIGRIEAGAAQEREERRSLYAAVSELRARVDSLDARVSDVEGRLDER